MKTCHRTTPLADRLAARRHNGRWLWLGHLPVNFALLRHRWRIVGVTYRLGDQTTIRTWI